MRFLLISAFLLCQGALMAQAAWISTDTPGWYHATSEEVTTPAQALQQAHQVWGLSADHEWELLATKTDEQGFLHQEYQLLLHGLAVDWARVKFHWQAGKLLHINAFVPEIREPMTPAAISPAQAIAAARAHVGADRYYWEEPEMELMRQEITGDPLATYAPQPELVWADTDFDWKSADYRLAWKMEIFALEPLNCQLVYVDANTGAILKSLSQTQHENVPGTAVTRYRGTQPIVSDSVNAAEFRLREFTRASQGIVTLDLNNGLNLTQAVDFVSFGKDWDLTNADWDEVSADVHWGSEQAYDIFASRYGFDSFNGAGGQIRSYVHYGPKSYANAFWNVDHAGYGDDGGTPHVGVDIVGHEVTHGVVRNTANLIYIDESAALNEGFADIFGNTIEALTDPSTASWDVGEDAAVFRSLSDPRSIPYPLTGQGHPDTYRGPGWYTGPGDNGGAHCNATVFGHWFYLVAEGGSGTNGIGNPYLVQGIGVEEAGRIAWRILETYLSPTSQFSDARMAAILSAEDLFGRCSPQWQSVVNAWYAVGLGSPVRDNDLGMIAVEVPKDCAVTNATPVIAYLQNFGCSTTAPNSFQVIYTLKNPLTVGLEVLNLPNGMAPGEVKPITFGQTLNLSSPRDYEITATGAFPGDPFAGNNESPATFVQVRSGVQEVHGLNNPFAKDTVAFTQKSQSAARLQAGVGTQSSVGILMEGGNGLAYRLVTSYPMWGGPPVDMFDFNPEFTGKSCFCVTDGEPRILSFERRQTFSTALKTRFVNEFPTLDGDSIMSKQGSILRVTADGEELARYYPSTPNQDTWSLEQLDLGPYAGSPFQLCFEGKMIWSRALDPTGVGDRIFLDNITFSRIATSIDPSANHMQAEVRMGGDPAFDLLHLNLPSSGGWVTVTVMDLQGKVWQSASKWVNSGANDLPLERESLPSAVYVLRVEVMGEVQHLRWMLR